MMRRIVKVRVQGQEVEAVEEDFAVAREEWNEYKLLDGGAVRVKTTVSRIYRLVDSEGNPRYDGDGSPSFVVMHKSDVVSRG